MSLSRRDPSTGTGNPTNGSATNGDAPQGGLQVGPYGNGQRQLSNKELSDAFSRVPWMEFNVTARPNLKTFASHPAIQQVISDVAHGTLDDVKQAITDNVNKSINDIVAKAVQDAIGDVPKHVMHNMAKTFNNLSLAPTTMKPATDFQPLQTAGVINNYNTDNSTHHDGNTININSNNTNTNSGNVNSGNNNNNPVISPSKPGPDTKPIDGPSTSPTVAPPDLGNSSAQWIWTNELPWDAPPAGPRAFRKTAVLPGGKQVDSMTIDITSDNCYTLYVNGYLVGNGNDWSHAQRFSIKFPSTNKILIAVYASNAPVVDRNVAGVISAAVMWDSTNSDGGSSNIYTDSSWKCSTTAASSGFEKVNYKPDGSWQPVRLEGPLVTPPWMPPLPFVTKPTSTNALNGAFSLSNIGIADPPQAPNATPGPDPSGHTTL